MSIAVLKNLEQLPGAVLKVYIYLCSLNVGDPFTVGSSTVVRHTGLKVRTVFNALRVLEQNGLIQRNRGSGRATNAPNIYIIPMDENRQIVARSVGRACTEMARSHLPELMLSVTLRTILSRVISALSLNIKGHADG